LPTSTLKKPRNYAAEYKRRLERAAKLGYSRAVARGHAPKSKYGIKEARKAGRRPGVPKGSQPTESEVFQAELFGKGFRNPREEARKERLRQRGIKEERIDQVITSQAKFIRVALKAGLTEKEAYSLWFSP